MKRFCLLLLFCVLTAIPVSYAQQAPPVLTLNTPMHTGVIRRISTDAQGKYLLTGSYDKTAKLWDAASGELLLTLRIPVDEGNEGMITACALSPDGKIAAVSGWTGFTWDRSISVYLFDLTENKMFRRIKDIPEVVNHLAFSNNGSFLAVAPGGKNSLMIYQTSDWILYKSAGGYDSDCQDIAFDASGRMATVCYDGKIRLYDANFTMVKSVKTSGDNKPSSVSFSADGSLLAVGYRDGDAIQVFDGQTLKLLYEPDISGSNQDDQRLVMVCFSSDGKSLAAGYSYMKKGADGYWFQIRIWGESGKGSYTDHPAGRMGVMDIVALPDNSFAFAGGKPDMGRISINGGIIFYRPSETNDYRSLNESNTYTIKDKLHFRVNSDGSALGIKPSGSNDISFRLNPGQLLNRAIDSGSPPVEERNGIVAGGWNNTRTPTLNGKAVSFLEPNERCLSVDISDDGQRIVFGGDFNTCCTDAKGNLIWKAQTHGMATCVNITGDGKSVIVAVGDGSLRWYSMDRGTLLFSLFIHPDNRRWVLWSPKGYFDCSQDADSLIGWHVNRGSDQAAMYFPASHFFEKFYVSNLGARLLSGEEVTPIGFDMNGMTLPPQVKITAPGDGIRGIGLTSAAIPVGQAFSEITIEVTDQGGGIDEVVLYQNGKLVHTTGKGYKTGEQKNATTMVRFSIDLIPGTNLIRASAFNRQRTESVADIISLNCTAVQPRKPDLYLLGIGIDQYKNPKYNLNYAVADVSAFTEEIKTGGKDIFGNIRSILIRNAEVTRDRVSKEIAEIKRLAKPEDVFMLYYAGHGVMSGGNEPQFFLVPWDVTQLYGNDQGLLKNGISATELQSYSSEIAAQKQLYVIDACQSGGMVGMLAARGAAEEKALNQLARSTGTFWLTATNTEQFAGEFSALKHGLFTWCILEGLSGKADGLQDKKITVQELGAYLSEEVPSMSERHKGSAQYPNIYGYGQDFPIVIIK